MERRIERARALLTRGHDALQVAADLRSLGHYRDVISRAYYAMFYAASAALAAEGMDSSKHAGVISLFGHHLVHRGPIEHEHHAALCQAFDAREMADYHLYQQFSEDEAAQRLRAARAFVERIERHLAEHHPGAATEDTAPG